MNPMFYKLKGGALIKCNNNFVLLFVKFSIIVILVCIITLFVLFTKNKFEDYFNNNILISRAEYQKLISDKKLLDDYREENTRLFSYMIEYADVLKRLDKLESFSIYDSKKQVEIMFQTTFSGVKIADDKKNQYIESIAKWSDFYKLPPTLIASIIFAESTFNEFAQSSAGAKGPMQVLPKWHKDKLNSIGISDNDLFNIDHGIHIGCWVYREYYDSSNRDVFKALIKYVGGNESDYIRKILTCYVDSKTYIKENETKNKS